MFGAIRVRPAVLKPNADGLLQMPDFDWCVIKLGHLGYVHEFEVDTNHFKGNFPESCLVQGINAPDARDADFSKGTRSHPRSLWGSAELLWSSHERCSLMFLR